MKRIIFSSFFSFVVLTAQAATDLPKPLPCIYDFPEPDSAIYDNIITLLPQNPPIGGQYALYDGGMAALNGRYPAPTKGEASEPNNMYHILIKEHPDREDLSYVGHFTLGSYLEFCETDVAVHAQTRLPQRLNVLTSFLPYTTLNLSGRVLADVSRMSASGLKIYSAGATFANGLSVVGSKANVHGKFVNVEIAGPTLVYNDFCLSWGYGMGQEMCMHHPGNTSGRTDDIHGALIYHARTDHTVENDDGTDYLYMPLTCMGDLTGSGSCNMPAYLDCITNNIIFYSKWDLTADTIEGRYNLPDENTPIFISNSLKMVWGDVDVFAVEKNGDEDMSPMPAVYERQYRRITGDEHHAQIHAALHADGRVYSYLSLDNRPIPNPLAGAIVVDRRIMYTPDEMLVLAHGGVIDMRKAGKEISFFNITAGTVTYGAGEVQVNNQQHITIEGHKTIRHEIRGYADMDITGKAESPVNVCFERLLEPVKDKHQARFELNTINLNHAHINIGPGNIVAGQVHDPDAGFYCNDNVELFNYGVITRDVHINATSRVVNSHYAQTFILKHPCCAPPIEIPLEMYPGSIHGNVTVGEGGEFCNYGDVWGDITVGADAILYGCGTCGGRVTLLKGAFLFFDHSLHTPPEQTMYFAQIKNDTTVKYRDGTVKYRPDGNVEHLFIEDGAALGFRISAPQVSPCPNVLTVRGKLEVKRELPVRLDIDGSITKLLPQNGTKGRVKLLRAIHPHRVKGMSKLKMYIASGADLVEQPKLVWEAREGVLYFEAKLSRKSQNEKSRKSRKNKRRKAR